MRRLKLLWLLNVASKITNNLNPDERPLFSASHFGLHWLQVSHLTSTWDFGHKLLVNRLLKPAQEKSVVKWADGPAMTIAVDMGRKATKTKQWDFGAYYIGYHWSLILAISPEPLLLAHTKDGSRWNLIQLFRCQVPLDRLIGVFKVWFYTYVTYIIIF